MKPHPQALCDRIERLSRVHSGRAIAEIVRLDPNVVSRIKRRGFKEGRTTRRPRPDDFAIMAEKITIPELCEHYRAGKRAVLRWSQEVERKPRWRVTNKLEIPAREAIEAAIRDHGLRGAQAALGCGETTLLRWRRHYGMVGPAPSQVGWADRYFQQGDAR